MTQHTPGPWRLETGIRQDSGQTQTEVWAGPASRIARVPHGEVYASNSADANARLIAAAPELLQALRFERQLEAANDAEAYPQFREMRDAAIAKAEEGS